MAAPSRPSSWRSWWRLGVRQKVVMILTATLIVALSASTWLALQDQHNDILDEARVRGDSTSQFIAEYLAYSVVAHDYHTIELLLKGLAQHNDVVSARVINARGNIMGEYQANQPAGADVIQFEKPIRLDGQELGMLHLGLSVRRDIDHLQGRTSNSFMRQFLVIFAIMVIELFALTFIIVRPLDKITRAIRAGDNDGNTPAPAIPVVSQDEFGEMAREFNALHSRLNEAHRRLQSRVDLANEELRRANTQLNTQADELKRRNLDLHMLALTDPLTGLYNKRYFETLLQNEIAPALTRDVTLSVLLINLTDLDRLNAEHGHDTADEAIKDIARRIAAMARPSDSLCRLEGGRFFLLCRQSTMASAIAHADEICQAICQTPARIAGLEITINAHIGIATVPGRQPVREAQGFIRCAEIALDQSRQLGDYGIAHYSLLDARPSPALLGRTSS
jgi:diguanylate cyclase (GGDEF)-like protein